MSSIPPPHTAKVLKIFEDNQTLTNDLVREIFTILENFAITKKMLSKIASKSEWFNDILENSGLNTLDLRVFFRDYYPNYEGYLKALKCPVCGKQMHYSPATNKIPIGCSSKCILAATKDKRCNTIINKYGGMGSASKAIRAKAEQTNLERYGTKNVRSSDFVKDKIRNTMMERYGVENALQSKEIRQKGEQTLIERYGVKNAQMNEEIKAKRIATNNETYGGNAPTCSKEVMDKVFATNIERYGVKTNFNRLKEDGTINESYLKIQKDQLDKSYNELFKFRFVEPAFPREEWHGHGSAKSMKLYKWRCKECGKVFESYINGVVVPPRCLDCHPYTVSKGQEELEEFIKSLGFEVVRNDRGHLNGYEIDVFLPELNVGFEYNGEFFHQDNPKDYHKMKTDIAEENGIHLIHIFETEWLYRQDLVKNRIKMFLGKVPSVYGRNCEVREISVQERKDFVNTWHMQSDSGARISIGLFYGGELVSVASFSTPRFNKNYEYELIRYCSSKRIVGGFSKILSYFEKTYSPKSLISYADRKWVNKFSNVYSRNGFVLDHVSEPSFFYTKPRNGIIVPRYAVQKPEELLGENYDPSKTVHENMTALGFVRNFDCGNLVYRKTF